MQVTTLAALLSLAAFGAAQTTAICQHGKYPFEVMEYIRSDSVNRNILLRNQRRKERYLPVQRWPTTARVHLRWSLRVHQRLSVLHMNVMQTVPASRS